MSYIASDVWSEHYSGGQWEDKSVVRTFLHLSWVLSSFIMTYFPYKCDVGSCYNVVGGVVHTHATILVQVAFYGALHRMLKGAYNSGNLTRIETASNGRKWNVCFRTCLSRPLHHHLTTPSFSHLFPFPFPLLSPPVLPLPPTIPISICRTLEVRTENYILPHCWPTAEICWSHRHIMALCFIVDSFN